MAEEPTRPPSEHAGDASDRLLRIGPFRLLERIGEGGMGLVYLAEREVPFKQRVALKVIRTGLLDRTYRARFAMEQQALERMDHPNVARLLDAGDDEGQSWFAMEHVPGQPLGDYCREHRLSLEQRLRLFQQVCDGVQHAHMKGILHRDLKPGNIMVHEVDGRAVAKIIDFGLAQPVDPLQIRASLHEAMRQIVGTVAYMSPEQADRHEGDLDTRTDVYSLGVVLYELLTGELPLDLAAIEERGVAALGALLRDFEPKKPSTRLSTLGDRLRSTAAERGLSPQRLRSLVRGELDWVTMKALERDRQRRYPTVRDLGREIERYLARRPVEAGPPTAAYVLRKWLQRHRAGVTVAAGAALASVVIGIVVWGLAARAREAERRREILDRAAVLAEHVRHADDLWPANASNVALLVDWLREAERLETVGASVASLAAVLAAEHEAMPTAHRDNIAEVAFGEQTRLLENRRQAGDELQRLIPIVAARLERARTLHRRTIDAYAEPWQEALHAVAADPRFAGLRLEPIPGLVPLGRDPNSGLQEFYLPDSAGDAKLPTRSDGGFEIGPMTGMVFVLVPGGEISLPETSSHSAWRTTVEPFLISRYETTQAQWARLAGEGKTTAVELNQFNPSNTPAELRRAAGLAPEPQPDEDSIAWDAVTWIHPVQQVSWQRAEELLPRWSLGLPSCAEWLRAAAASDEAPMRFDWLRERPHSLANLRNGEVDDGFMWTAPVGRFAPNPWGLHDVFGNVAELCRDGYRENTPGFRVPDARATKRAVLYGMSFLSSWQPALLPVLGQLPIQNIHAAVGIRPVFRFARRR